LISVIPHDRAEGASRPESFRLIDGAVEYIKQKAKVNGA
jgi:hypothetical protein